MTFENAVHATGVEFRPGKQALKNSYKSQVTAGNGCRITGSVDLDSHFSATEPHAHRWDYGCGFKNGEEFAIWIEPHPANSGSEIDVMLKKLCWLKQKLSSNEFERLNELTNVAIERDVIPFRWLYSGKMRFKRGGKEEKLLAKNGMKLPERKIEIR